MATEDNKEIIIAGKVLKGSILVFLLKRYFRNILVMLDQSLNVWSFGDEDETISSRLGKSQRGDFGAASKAASYPLARAVDYIALKVFKDPDHCKTNIEEGVGRNALKALYNDYKAQKKAQKLEKENSNV